MLRTAVIAEAQAEALERHWDEMVDEEQQLESLLTGGDAEINQESDSEDDSNSMGSLLSNVDTD